MPLLSKKRLAQTSFKVFNLCACKPWWMVVVEDGCRRISLPGGPLKPGVVSFLTPPTLHVPKSSGSNSQLCALSLSLCTFRSSVPGCWEIYLSYFKKALAVGCCRVTGTMLGPSSFASGTLCSSDQVCPPPVGASLHVWFDCHAVFTLPPLLLLSQL